jgi:uncharacterized protein YraI
MFKRGLLFLTIITSLLLAGIAIAQTPITEIAGTTLATVKMRIAPGQTHTIITTLPFNLPLMIEARNNVGDWMLVRTEQGERGWVASRYVSWAPDIELATFAISVEVFGEVAQPTLQAPQNPGTPQAVVLNGIPGRTLARLNVRSGADVTAAIIGKMDFRTSIIIEARNNIGNWLLVSSESAGLRGWVAARYVSWSPDVELASFPLSTEGAENIIAPEATPEAVAGTSGTGTTFAVPEGTTAGRSLVNQLNVRAGAGATFESLVQINLNTPVAIEGRNFIGDWLLISTLDGAARGWVASRFVGWSEEIPLGSFPITSEVIQPA